MTEKKIVLDIKDRLNMLGLLPKESDRIEQIIIKNILNKVEINQEEMKEINLKKEGNQWKWDSVKGKEIVFTEIEFDVIKKSIDKLDKDKKITQENLPLCVKIWDFKEKDKPTE